ncbi:hypothetical protein ABEB36_008941 [Hypothenemus hampei]|uniref:Cuticle protein n=1 Tax=Hypothenemus hampei TaxID=57062 RepID=A0ABD1ENL3_HYPHA
MKVLLFLCSCLAAASAVYYSPQHIPVIGPNGVPIEPYEVQAARASHLAALASAHSGVAAPYYSAPSAPFTAFAPIQTLTHNALPLDTPEVASARLQHFRDYAAAAQKNGVHVPLVPQLAGPYPLDTPEVQQAKAAHFQAHAEALARAGPASYYHSRKRRDVYGGYHVPVIGPNGVPVDTPEVQAARANHLAALTQAGSVNGPAHFYSGVDADAYSEPYRRYYGPQATIGPDGQPIETPEVKAAKAYHFAAYSAALTGSPLSAAPHYY